MQQSDTQNDLQESTVLAVLTALKALVTQNPACGACQQLNVLTSNLRLLLYDHPSLFSTHHTFYPNVMDQEDLAGAGS